MAVRPRVNPSKPKPKRGNRHHKPQKSVDDVKAEFAQTAFSLHMTRTMTLKFAVTARKTGTAQYY